MVAMAHKRPRGGKHKIARGRDGIWQELQQIYGNNDDLKKKRMKQNRGNFVETTIDKNNSLKPIKSFVHSFIDIGMHSFQIVPTKPRDP